ncbi:MAG: carboxypeptidase regulatory-like domain-containing protein, partial [Abditibacteriota bacterium]|nr:carboxypeptidase regulatory-like domain-containing protein [Abditibacteriota bacterium]
MMIDHCRFVGNGVADEGCIVIGNKVNGDNYVYHNVFDSNVFGLRVWGQGQPVHVANNIFTGNTGAALYGDWDARNTHLYNNCFFDNNEIYAWINTIAGNCWTDHGGNIEADPMFVDNTIYEVGELSPVIDAGCMLGFDYDGNAPDIGCFESLYTAIDYGFVTGVVTDDATGAPIAGAAVTIGESTAITDENGEYSLTASGGQVEITVTAEGYADESGTASVVLRETTEKDFALTAAYTVIDNMADLDEAETGEYVKVTFDAKAVTSAGDFADGSLYIESGLFAGYKLILSENADINAGDTFTFMGVVRSDSGGKYVEVASVTPKGSGEAPRPVGMTNSMLYSNALVRVWGKVVALGNGSAVITGGTDNITILLEGNDAP